MDKRVLTVLLVGLILISLLAPFSGLALLMLVLFGSTLAWVGWTLLRTLITGNSESSNGDV
ncbi:hypothetical protein IQ268_29065 [Oculatella sp. LEGE 06141]|uniref:hypothetical protein n=1 Tax=Oculatella sp. LEGE 06141 TaxID=1828648 RepID=UPI00187FCFBC|nr:hypothetical protein [Oculatella sp. LEGE 06141]MBE9182604.1 hypothetical protein [Oculatella sp. LEGE 06141]